MTLASHWSIRCCESWYTDCTIIDSTIFMVTITDFRDKVDEHIVCRNILHQANQANQPQSMKISALKQCLQNDVIPSGIRYYPRIVAESLIVPRYLPSYTPYICFRHHESDCSLG